MPHLCRVSSQTTTQPDMVLSNSRTDGAGLKAETPALDQHCPSWVLYRQYKEGRSWQQANRARWWGRRLPQHRGVVQPQPTDQRSLQYRGLLGHCGLKHACSVFHGVAPSTIGSRHHGPSAGGKPHSGRCSAYGVMASAHGAPATRGDAVDRRLGLGEEQSACLWRLQSRRERGSRRKCAVPDSTRSCTIY